jgi:hypothetical protein
VLAALVDAPARSPASSASALSVDDFAAGLGSGGDFAASLGGGDFAATLSGDFGASGLAGQMRDDYGGGGPFDFQASVFPAPQFRAQQQQQTKFDALAREFRCDPSLIEALAARLAAGELV